MEGFLWIFLTMSASATHITTEADALPNIAGILFEFALDRMNMALTNRVACIAMIIIAIMVVPYFNIFMTWMLKS